MKDKSRICFAFICVLFFSFASFSCKSVPYLERDFLENEGAPVPLEDRPELDNVNGSFPEKIWIKTLTQTFGNEYEFLLDDGKIWFKKIGTSAEEWQLYLGTGLPFSPKKKFASVERVVEICADADCLYAFSSEGKLYRTYLKKITSYPPMEWVDYFGWPKKIQLYQNASVAGKIGWAVGSSRKDVEYYEDACGNKHNYGPLGVESITFLGRDGRYLRYSDPACPSDFSHSFSIPKDEDFCAVNISESASTIFLIGKDGSMYTRLVDYNTVGSDPMLYPYTYEPYSSDFDGSEEKSNVTPWFLPNAPWEKQPPVSGAKSLSKYITIIQTGKGNDERELRVAGISSDDKVGFFYKKITEQDWKFKEAPLFLPEDLFSPEPESLSESESFAFEPLSAPQNGFSGYLWKNGERIQNLSCTIENFDFSEGPCELCVSFSDSPEDDSLLLRFYYSEIWTPFFRLTPGTSFEPLRYFGTLVSSSDDFFDDTLLTTHKFLIQACLSYISIKFESADDVFEFYLTCDGNLYFSPSVDRDLRTFVENSDKINSHALKNAKKRARKASSMKSGLKFAKIVSKTLFLDKTVDKIGIISKYSDEISSVNEEYYKNQKELMKFVLRNSYTKKAKKKL